MTKEKLENEKLNYISGTLYSYSFLCMRKVWLSAHNVSMEQNSSNVSIGKIIDENTYKKERHSFMIDNKINIDFLRNNIVHEIKKSKSKKEMAINQIKYYLFILRNYGFDDTKGCLNIPSIKYKEEVVLEDTDKALIIKRLDLINSVIASKKIPEVINKKFCTKCAYYELCYI